MRKTVVFLLLLALLLTIGFLPVKAVSETNIDLWIGKTMARINGEIKTLDAAPYIKNNRTMVPIRFVSEQMGAKVDWINSERKVAITLGPVVISLWIDKTVAYVNGVEKKIDAPPEIAGSHTFVPIRFISDNMGAQVYWVDSEKRITVVQKIAPALTSTPSPITSPIPKPGDTGGDKIKTKQYLFNTAIGDEISVYVGTVSYRAIFFSDDYTYTYGLEFYVTIDNIGKAVDFFYIDNLYLLDPQGLRIIPQEIDFAGQGSSATLAPGEYTTCSVRFYGNKIPVPNADAFKDFTNTTTLPSDTAFAYWRFVFRPSAFDAYALKFNFGHDIAWSLLDQDKVTP